jgi:hypothetical protein
MDIFFLSFISELSDILNKKSQIFSLHLFLRNLLRRNAIMSYAKLIFKYRTYSFFKLYFKVIKIKNKLD